jgi:hypothetical protein
LIWAFDYPKSKGEQARACRPSKRFDKDDRERCLVALWSASDDVKSRKQKNRESVDEEIKWKVLEE